MDELVKIQSEYLLEAAELHIQMNSESGVYFLRESIVWVPSKAKDIQLRLLIIAHCGCSGHRGISATLFASEPRFYWENMKSDVRVFCKQCIHYTVNSGGNVVPRPLGTALHATKPNLLIHFDFLALEKSSSNLQKCQLKSPR